MTSKIKRVTVAFLATLAIGAVSASAASAASFNFEKNNSSLSGAQTNANEFSFTGGNFKCTVATASSGAYPEGSQESVSLTPNYAGCTWFGQQMIWKMNGCTEKVTANSATAGTFAIDCPAGQKIDIEMKNFCHIYIPAQTPKSPNVTLSNWGSGVTREVLLTRQVGGISYTSTGGFCGAS